jgi:hypothetical protein
MSRSTELGRLVIAWGPEAHNYSRLVRRDPYETIFGFIDYHAGAINNDPDPFSSIFFGAAVKALLAGKLVVLTDGVFADPRRRKLVEQAFQRVFPGLVVEQRQLGDDPDLVGTEPAEQGIVIDNDVYGEGDMSSNESIIVESQATRDALIAALTSAAVRMMSVGEDGQEYGDVEARTNDGNEIYTPNYVSEVTLDEMGNPGFYIDCKGAIEPPMGERFRQILTEELQRRGIRSAHIRTPD